MLLLSMGGINKDENKNFYYERLRMLIKLSKKQEWIYEQIEEYLEYKIKDGLALKIKNSKVVIDKKYIRDYIYYYVTMIVYQIDITGISTLEAFEKY